MLTVAHIVQSFEIGGLERMVVALARGGAALGVRACAAAYLSDGPIRAALASAGAPAEMIGGRGGGLRPALPLSLARWLRRVGADVCHSHHVGPFLYGGAAARIVGVPHVHTEHSVELYDAPRRHRLGWLMPRVSTVVSVSPAVAAWRLEQFGHAGEVVANGVPIPVRSDAARAAARARLGVSEDAFVVGCVARLALEKDHRTLIAAARAVPEAVFVLVGDGPERQALERLAADAGPTANVRFTGEVNDVDALYPGFDLVTLSSTREGLPMALLEGMAHGLPVVATAVGGVPALLADGAGLTTPPGDPGALAAAIQSMVDPARRAPFAEAARRTVEARYSVEQMSAEYARIYRRLTA